MLDDYLDVLTIDDVAAILRISRRSVMHLIENQELEYRKIGRIYRISKAALSKYLESNAS